jgi:exonuclease VII large subunit
MNQTQAQNQQLQTTITRQSAMISQLNQQLTSANTAAQTYEAVAAIFIIGAVALAGFSIYQKRNKSKIKNVSEANGKIALAMFTLRGMLKSSMNERHRRRNRPSGG